jgi:hypothetical protein
MNTVYQHINPSALTILYIPKMEDHRLLKEFYDYQVVYRQISKARILQLVKGLNSSLYLHQDDSFFIVSEKELDEFELFGNHCIVSFLKVALLYTLIDFL